MSSQLKRCSVGAQVGRITYLNRPPVRGLRPGKVVVLCTGQQGYGDVPRWQYAGARLKYATTTRGDFVPLAGTNFYARLLTPWVESGAEALRALKRAVA